ncbi:hypothetical protein BP5796_01654 [Coleophoma crateriformis]|uniref:C2H2-type domain-containing protein n=1 Tax=Coleophoma crateriformis TaxID=565419 RepID=A0A3D8T157_9HELO|nr:hypothetical protein BP5796_01654 [Coleophoma crateriformis]
MTSYLKYPHDGTHSGHYYPPNTLMSSDTGQYGSSRMAPPHSDLPPQPVEIDLNNPRTLPSPSLPHNWDPALFQPSNLGDLPSPYVSAVVKEPHHHEGQGRPTQDPIASWYTENDGPWIPKGSLSTLATDDRLELRPTTGRASVPFGGQYRPTNPLENGTLQYGVPPSDSGYGTRRSVGTASVFAADSFDRDQDCQSLVSHGGEYPSFQGLEGMPQLETHDVESWAPIPNTAPAYAPHLVCPFPECRKQVKTRSELKKHELRHTRPFTCTIPTCTRKVGFSTPNDLTRHMQSKHPEDIKDANVISYRCRVLGCKAKEKSWARLDNFRSHLKRVHKLPEDDLDMSVKQAEYRANSGITHTSNKWEATETDDEASEEPKSSMGVNEYASLNPALGSIANFAGVKRPLAHDSDFETARSCKKRSHPKTIQLVPGQNNNTTIIPDTSETAFIGLKRELATPSDRTDFEVAAMQPRGKTVMKAAAEELCIGDQNQAHKNLSKLSTSKTFDGVATSKSQESCQESSSGDDRKDISEALKLLREEGYNVEKKHSKINAGSVASNKSELKEICNECHRFRGRPCEMKKHMKRHQRPYGCTDATCNKTFGSKNDWKRHENSQHLKLETWCCQELTSSGGICSKNFHRRQSIKDHLTKDHSIHESANLDAKLELSRIGRSFQGRFWCGFCIKLVDLKGRGLDTWSERFDHIDDHFMGRRGQRSQRISAWVHHGGNSGGSLVERFPSAPSSEADSEANGSDTIHGSYGRPSPASSNGSGDGPSPPTKMDVEQRAGRQKNKHYVKIISCVGCPRSISPAILISTTVSMRS